MEFEDHSIGDPRSLLYTHNLGRITWVKSRLDPPFLSKTAHQTLYRGMWPLAEPDRSWANPGKLTKPKTMRVLLMNLGEKDASNVNVRLHNPKEKGGNVFAQGTVNVPCKSVAIAVLPVTAKWQVWKTWNIEVDGNECEVLIFPKDIT